MTEALKDYLVVLAVNLALIAYVALFVASAVGAVGILVMWLEAECWGRKS